MKKMIVFISLAAVFLFLMAPFSSAMNYTILKEKKINQQIKESVKIGTLTIKDHPILYLFYFLIWKSLGYRAAFWANRANIHTGPHGFIRIGYPSAFFKFIFLWLDSVIWQRFWFRIAEKNGWNW